MNIVQFLSDPGAIQTHDLQNRNLTLYSLSYGAKNVTKVEKNYQFAKFSSVLINHITS